MRLWHIALALLPISLAASCVNDSWRVHYASAQIRSAFPPGMTFDSAQLKARANYPRSIVYSPAECEYGSHHGVPAYPARGGRCIFGIKEVPGILWGDVSVSFRLMFSADGALAMRYLDPIYTFL